MESISRARFRIHDGCLAAVAAFALFSAASAHAGPSVDIHIEMTVFEEFVAASKEVSGKVIRNADGSFLASGLTLKLDSLETGIGLRDRHMKERYFETKRYPNAVLNGKGKNGKFTGTLMLRGVTQPVSGTYEVEGNEVVAEFKTKVSGFKIKPPKHLGVGIEDEVVVKGRFPFESGKR